MLAERYPLRLIQRLDARNGLSGAVIRGLEAATGEYFVVMDADLQHPPEKIPALLNELRNDRAELALGPVTFPAVTPKGTGASGGD